ncbi:MAG: type II secretion system protein M, partial [Thiogranum sp.]|nr:type II secretion system protein M [Thiogranum sp.]
MKDWFLGLEPRERKLVTAGAVVLVLLLLYVLVWEPVVGKYAA